MVGEVDEEAGSVDCGAVAFLVLFEHAKHLPHAQHIGCVKHLDRAAPVSLWTAGTKVTTNNPHVCVNYSMRSQMYE